MKRCIIVAACTFALVTLGACSPGRAAPTSQAALPNPASVYCEQNGGKLDLRTGAAGGVSGICLFPDGSECDEWTYFRGECKPGDSLAEPGSLTLAALQNAIYHSLDWGTYKLVDGQYHRPPNVPGASSDAYLTQMIEPTTFGDLNGDGIPDAVVFLSTQNGGTGHFREMAAVINRGGLPDNVSTISLGDRVVIEAAQIDAGVVTLQMRVQGPGDGLCCPSQAEVWRFRLEADSLVRLP